MPRKFPEVGAAEPHNSRRRAIEVQQFSLSIRGRIEFSFKPEKFLSAVRAGLQTNCHRLQEHGFGIGKQSPVPGPQKQTSSPGYNIEWGQQFVGPIGRQFLQRSCQVFPPPGAHFLHFFPVVLIFTELK